MHFTIRLHGDSGTDDLRELWSWLTDEEELRGRVTVTERAPDRGQMGSITDALVAALAPGGAVVVLVGAVLRWLRYRRGDLSVTVERGADKVSVNATRVRGLDQAGVAALVREVANTLTDDADTPDTPDTPSLNDVTSNGDR